MTATPTAPQEVELKFEVEPECLANLLSHPLLRPAAGYRRTNHTLVSTYFDTPGFDLREHGLSLRIRRDGTRRVQTLKATSSGAGAFARAEWEHVVTLDRPDLSRFGDTPLETLSDLFAVIGARFSVSVTRTAIELAFGESLIEVALDRGEVAAGGATVFAEVELELKRGELRDAFALARELIQDAPLRLSFRTKAERGYAAVVPREIHRIKAEPVDLRRGLSSARAFRIIGHGCVKHLMANEVLFREAPHPDAVHQMRVALRRLRAAISLFKEMVDDDQRVSISRELKWMAGELGKARDLDVYIAKVLEPAQASHGHDAGFKDLVAAYRHRRDRAYQDVEQTIRSTRFLGGALAAAAWIETGEWLSDDRKSARQRRREPVEDLAEAELARRWKKIRKRGKHLKGLAPEERHQVRIDIKKLRYASEFFTGLYRRHGARKKQKHAVAVLEHLQERLGDLNDIAVGAGMDGAPAGQAVHQEQLARVPGLLDDARRHYRTFSEMEPFWDRG
ncbi:MAG: CHAD domain-containing protein [Microvirga sp.]